MKSTSVTTKKSNGKKVTYNFNTRNIMNKFIKLCSKDPDYRKITINL